MRQYSCESVCIIISKKVHAGSCATDHHLHMANKIIWYTFLSCLLVVVKSSFTALCHTDTHQRSVTLHTCIYIHNKTVHMYIHAALPLPSVQNSVHQVQRMCSREEPDNIIIEIYTHYTCASNFHVKIDVHTFSMHRYTCTCTCMLHVYYLSLTRIDTNSSGVHKTQALEQWNNISYYYASA